MDNAERTRLDDYIRRYLLQKYPGTIIPKDTAFSSDMNAATKLLGEMINTTEDEIFFTMVERGGPEDVIWAVMETKYCSGDYGEYITQRAPLASGEDPAEVIAKAFMYSVTGKGYSPGPPYCNKIEDEVLREIFSEGVEE